MQCDRAEHVQSRDSDTQNPFVLRSVLVMVCEKATDYGHETLLHTLHKSTHLTFHTEERREDQFI